MNCAQHSIAPLQTLDVSAEKHGVRISSHLRNVSDTDFDESMQKEGRDRISHQSLAVILLGSATKVPCFGEEDLAPRSREIVHLSENPTFVRYGRASSTTFKESKRI